MKPKIFLTALFLISLFLHLKAQEVNSSTAIIVGKNYYWRMLKQRANKGNKSVLAYESIKPKIILTRKDDNARNVFYILNINDNNGFVIVSGDKKTRPVLAYSIKNNFDITNIPPALKDWLEYYYKQIIYARTKQLNVPATFKTEWQNLRYNLKEEEPVKPIVGPLLERVVKDKYGNQRIQWSQQYGYRDECPAIPNPTDQYHQHVPDGCLATAMGQVMKFHNYPNRGNGSHIDKDNQGKLKGTYFADFGSTMYNWFQMPNDLYNDQQANIAEFKVIASKTEVYQVSRLLSHCGISVDMDYEEDGSGAPLLKTKDALSSYFNYSKNIEYISRKDYHDDEWERLLKNEIENNRPVLYGGFNIVHKDGHAFVCDGYDSDNNFHFNWGWSGFFNGWYTLSALKPNNKNNFSYYQEAVIGIKLPQDKYEPNNTEQKATIIYPVKFNQGVADITTGNVNIDTPSDIDYYKFTLPKGYNYTVDAKIYDFNNWKDEFFSGDFYINYKAKGAWGEHKYDNTIPAFTISNGGDVSLEISPKYALGQTATGTYKLVVHITRSDIPKESKLTVNNLTVSPTSVEAGKVISVNGTINNQGNIASANGTIKCYLSKDNLIDNTDELLDKIDIKPIEPNSSFSINNWMVTIPAGETVGNYYLLFIGNTESNNHFKKNIAITVVKSKAGHDLKLFRLNVDKEWLKPGESLGFDFVVRNPGQYSESNYTLQYQLLDANGNVVKEESESGVKIGANQIIPDFKRVMRTSSSYPDGFYTLKVSILFPEDYAQGNNALLRTIYIGNSNPFQTYLMHKDDVLLVKNNTYTLAGHSVKFTALDKKKARVIVDGTQKDISLGEFSFFDAYRFNLIYKGYFSSTEAGFRYSTPSTAVSFSPQALTIEAGKTGTFSVKSNEEDPTPNIEIASEGGLDAPVVKNWKTKAYVRDIPYSDVFFDITVPANAQRKTYNFWVNMSAKGAFYQKLQVKAIDPLPDFKYLLDKNTITAAPGMSNKISMSFEPLNGFNEKIVLSTSNLPEGISITPSINSFNIPNSVQLTITIDSTFKSFGRHVVELNLVSGTKSKTENIYINVVDNSKNILTITNVKYIDKDSKLDSLEIFYNAKFEYDNTASTCNWQYQINGKDWIDIPSEQILNNGPKEEGDTSIIWKIPGSSVLYSKRAKFRMKNKNGPDFLTKIKDYHVDCTPYDHCPDFDGIYIGDSLLYGVDTREANGNNYIRIMKLGSLSLISSYKIGQTPRGDPLVIEKCYNRFYLYDNVNNKLYIYNSSFSYLGSRSFNELYKNIQTIDGLLYIYYCNSKTSVSKSSLIQLDKNGNKTGVVLNMPFLYRDDYSLYDGKNFWLGNGKQLYKISQDRSGYTTYNLGDYYLFGTYYNDYIYLTSYNADFTKFSFFDPYSFYAESQDFKLNNTYRPVCDTLIEVYLTEDTIAHHVLDLPSMISDLDTPFDKLKFTLTDIDTNINVAFNADSTSLSIVPDSNWNGTCVFSLIISDDYNLVTSKIKVHVKPVDDAPTIKHIRKLTCNEDDSIVIWADTVFSDIDNTFKTLNVKTGLVNNQHIQSYIDTLYHLIIFKPDANYHCDSTLAFIRVKDSSGLTAADTFLVNVVSVNDAPNEFSKLSPLENLCENQKPVTFIWSKSSDVDNDSIYYLLSIKSDNIDTLIITSDTLASLNTSYISKESEKSTTFYWDVYAYDSIDIGTSGSPRKLTISKLSEETNLTDSICQGDSIRIGNSVFSKTGNYSVALTNQCGCDSIVNLNLTVNTPDETNLTESICQSDSVRIGDSVFSKTGNYSVTLINQNGCDSIVNLNLTVNTPDETNLTESICQGDSIRIGNSVFSTTGNYSVILTSQYGCDSVVNLDLTVNTPDETNLTESICQGDSIRIGNSVFSTTGNYSVILTSQYGCDSVVNLDLTVNTPDETNLTESICQGDNIRIGDSVFSKTGNYSVTLPNQYGCDSVVNLDLTVNSNPNVFLGSDTTINYDEYVILDAGSYFSYLWSTGQSSQKIRVDSLYGIGQHEISVVVYNKYGCSSSDTVIVTILNTATSIPLINEKRLLILYPNPTTGKLFMKFGNINNPFKVIIYSESGKIIFIKNFESINKSQVETINLYGNNSGLYFIRLTNSKINVVQKFRIRK